MFISYNMGTQQESADALAKPLREKGYRVFTASSSIPQGADWRSSIHNAIMKSEIFFALINDAYFNSAECTMEITAAIGLTHSQRKRGQTKILKIIPVLFKGYDPSNPGIANLIYNINAVSHDGTLLTNGSSATLSDLIKIVESLVKTTESRKHVMISCNWAQKDMVTKFTRLLREEGIDVWRDEDGSRILPGLIELGGVKVGMEKAVEHSNAAIICVSREYAESSNCGLELAYLGQQNVPLVFVMMQEDFKPSQITGLLGMHTARSSYFELFDESDIRSVTEKVSKRILTPSWHSLRDVFNNTIGMSQVSLKQFIMAHPGNEGNLADMNDLCAYLVAFFGLSSDSDTVVQVDAVNWLFTEVLTEEKSLTAALITIREHMYFRFHEEALRQGSLPFRRSRLMIVGEGAAGKSSFLRALTDQPFICEHKSTVGMQVDDFKAELREAGVDVVECASWKEYDCKSEESRSLGQAAVCNALKPSQPNWLTSRTKAVFLDTKSSDSTQSNKNTSNIDPSETTKSEIQVTSTPITQVNSTVQIDSKEETAKSKEDFQILSNAEAGALTFSCWDFGGQRVFQSVQHLLLSRLGVYALVFDMRKLVVGTIIGDQTVTAGSVTDAFNYIQFWLRQIQLLALGAPVYLIGTRKDVISEPTIHAEISKTLETTFRNSDLTLVLSYVKMNGSLCFYPVSNVRGNDEDEAVFKHLRTSIDKSAEEDPLGYVNEPIPLSWLKVCDEFRSLAKRNTPYLYRKRQNQSGSESVFDICTRLGVFEGVSAAAEKGQRLDAMLAMLHRLGIILYFQEVNLKDVVVLDSQWIIDVIVGVVRDYDLHPLERDKRFKLHYRAHWNNLRRSGVLAETMLRSFWSEEENNFDFLLALMKQLGLLCALPNADPDIYEQQYLVPSVLMVDKGVREHSSADSSSSQTQLQKNLGNRLQSLSQITFQGLLFMPDGFLPRLIVELASKCKQVAFVDTLKISTPCLFNDEAGNLNAVLTIFSRVVMLSQRTDCIAISIVADIKAEGIPDVTQELRAACESVTSRFYSMLASLLTVEQPQCIEVIPQEVEELSDEGDTDGESLASLEANKKIDSTAEDEVMRECLEPMCGWLKDIGIKSEQKRKNTATTIIRSGWDDKNKIIKFFKLGKITNDDIAIWFRITGDKECFISALEAELENVPPHQGIDSAVTQGQKDPTGTSRTHVMMSYCWAQKDLVIKLTKLLRDKQHDIWRDEDGSTILKNMEELGGINFGMAKAIEHSNAGIVCVSREYAISRNCMKELEYFDLRRIPNLIFVMMEKDLKPSDFTGPLPVIIGSSVYYYLICDSDVSTVAEKVSKRLSTAPTNMPINANGNTTPPQYATPNPVSEGWLLKRSMWLQIWRMRYFVLTNRTLSFATTEGGTPHGSITCSAVKIEKVSSYNSIVVTSVDGQLFYLRSEGTDNTEIERWVDAINRGIAEHKKSSTKSVNT